MVECNLTLVRGEFWDVWRVCLLYYRTILHYCYYIQIDYYVQK